MAQSTQAEVQEPLAEVIGTPSEVDPVTQSGDRTRHENDLARIQAKLAKQPKVSIKLQEDTFVGVDGYPFYIKGKVRVSVPQQVADILEEGGRI